MADEKAEIAKERPDGVPNTAPIIQIPRKKFELLTQRVILLIIMQRVSD